MMIKSCQHKYQEICEIILKRIEMGELEPGEEPGDRLTCRKLGEEFGCNYHTVRHAFAELAKQGYVHQKPGSGTYITERANGLHRSKVMVDKKIGETNKIGVILPLERWNHYQTSLIEKLHESALKKDVSLSIHTTGEIDINTEVLVRELSGQGCCAVILPWIGEGEPSGLHDFIRASELPVVLPKMIHGLEGNCYHESEVDHEDSSKVIIAAGLHLHSMGYKNISLLASKSQTSNHALVQYINWIDDKRKPNLLEVVEDGCMNFNCVIDRWLPLRKELAVIVDNDDLALDFMGACKKRGVVVPDDFAIIGHGNSPCGKDNVPALSTTSFPIEWMADGMISHALSLCRGSDKQKTPVHPLVFHVRDSCGASLKRSNSSLTGSSRHRTLSHA